MAKQQVRRKASTPSPPGAVSDLQIAFLVDCYLKDHSYCKTHSQFRAEASSIFSSCHSEAPMKMMSLRAILNDYIVLKEQALAVQQEKAKMDHLFARIKDVVMTYDKAPAAHFLPPLEAPPGFQSIRAETTSAKRKTSPNAKEPMVEITNTATGTKRIRHGAPAKTDNPNTSCTPLPSKRTSPSAVNKLPYTPARQLPLDPHTPQRASGMNEQQQCTFQLPPPTLDGAATPSVRVISAAATSCEPSKARSKRSTVKLNGSKCKSLDFTTSEPVFRPAPLEATEQEKLSLPLPLGGLLCEEEEEEEEIFTVAAAPLSSIDDILGASLDGSSFSELMNSMLVDDAGPEINSPEKPLDLSVPDCLDLDEELESASAANVDKENTPPRRTLKR